MTALATKSDGVRVKLKVSSSYPALVQGKPMNKVPVKAMITSDDLAKIDIRTGTIERVSDVAGSDKLVRLVVDFGDFTRTVLVGLKQERDDPSEITGRQALFVVNIEPRKMLGEQSEVMMFDMGYENGIRPVLAAPEHPVPNGASAS